MGPRGCVWEWKRLYNEKLHSLLVKLIKSRSLRWAGHIARMEEYRSAFKILTVKPTGKRPLERPRRRWEGSIRMTLNKQVSVRGIGLIRLRIGIIGERL